MLLTNIYLTVYVLLHCCVAAYSSECNPDHMRYTFKGSNHGIMEILAPVKRGSENWYLVLQFSGIVCNMFAVGFNITQLRKRPVEFQFVPHSRSVIRATRTDLLKIVVFLTFDSRFTGPPSVTKLSCPHYTCRTKDQSNSRSKETCASYSCTGSDCGKIIRVIHPWEYALVAHFNIPVSREITGGWELKVSFDKEIRRFITQGAAQISVSCDGITAQMTNHRSNGKVPVGKLNFTFVAYKEPGNLKISSVELKSTKCKFLSNATPTPTTTKESSPCHSFECKGSRCQHYACISKNSQVDTEMSIEVPVTCAILGWELTLEFDMSVTDLTLSNTILKSKSKNGKVFILKSIDSNKQPKQKLKIGFVAHKSGWEMPVIVRAEFRAIQCLAKCPVAPPTAQPPRNCPVTFCKGKTCENIITMDYLEGVTVVNLGIESYCDMRGWKAEVTFKGPVRNIGIDGAQLVRISKDKKHYTIKSTSLYWMPKGSGIRAEFFHEGGTENYNMRVSQFRFIPLQCTWPRSISTSLKDGDVPPPEPDWKRD